MQSVDRALASMQQASIAFNSPETLNRDDTAVIQLLLDMRQSVQALKAQVSAEGEKMGATVRATSRMQAKLTGADFRITPITDEFQSVGSLEPAEWKWEVKPVTPGKHELHLALTAIFDVDGAPSKRMVRSFDKTIEVQVGPGQWASDFLGRSWQWVWAAVLLPVIGYARNRYKAAKAKSGTA